MPRYGRFLGTVPQPTLVPDPLVDPSIGVPTLTPVPPPTGAAVPAATRAITPAQTAHVPMTQAATAATAVREDDALEKEGLSLVEVRDPVTGL